MDTTVYKIGEKLYINLTNRCGNDCVFCVRAAQSFDGFNLWLQKEPTAAEVLAAVDEELKAAPAAEAVFCGYGEPLYRLDVLTEVARGLKARGLKTRLNTNGQAEAICGGGIAEKLVGLVDTVSISLNAPNAQRYQELCRSEYGGGVYAEIINFSRDLCTKTSPKIRVKMTVVDCISEAEIEECARIAADVGAEFYVRKELK